MPKKKVVSPVNDHFTTIDYAFYCFSLEATDDGIYFALAPLDIQANDQPADPITIDMPHGNSKTFFSQQTWQLIF